jgi:hypothetical protein
LNLLGDLPQSRSVDIDADVEPVGIFSGCAADEQTIPGAEIDRYPVLVRCDQLLKCRSIELLRASSANPA